MVGQTMLAKAYSHSLVKYLRCTHSIDGVSIKSNYDWVETGEDTSLLLD